MKKIRIGNDLRISWGITTNGKQESLEGKFLKVQIVVYNRVIDIEDFTINGNVISFDFLGANQKYCGVYTLVLRDSTNGNQSTIDKTDAFELVPHTEEEAGKDNPKVALEVVTLATDRDSSHIGQAATVVIGKVETLPSGALAYVRNSGTANDAVLDFGIPSGGTGESGTDGIGIMAEPSSVTFTTNDDGTIPSEQDKLIRMKAYVGGSYVCEAEIKEIAATNFKNTPSVESDGSSFYVRGSDLQSIATTDLNDKAITIPATQAQVNVTCKMPNSGLLYTACVNVFTNTQSFYHGMVSNQKETRQWYTELNNSLTDQGVTLEKYNSEWQQTARGITQTVAYNKQDADGKIESAKSEIKQTADSITATVESYKTDADGKIEAAKTEIKQTTDEIKATVEANKQDTDGKIETAKSEIKQTTDEISATVSKNKELADGRIEDCKSSITQSATQLQAQVSSLQTDVNGRVTSLQSQITQNANSIAVFASKFNDDGTLKNTSGLLTTADKAALVSKEYVDGKVVTSAEISTMIKNGISTASISADQINFNSSNAKFTGSIYAKNVFLTFSSKDDILSGSVLFGLGPFTMPEVPSGTVISIKLIAPRAAANPNTYPQLNPANSNVYLWTCLDQATLPVSEKKVLDFGVFDLIGYGGTNITYWYIG